MRFRRTGVLFVLALLLCCAASTPAKEKVIHDADMGIFNDDAHALIMLINSGVVEILGVTTVAGNAWVENCTAAAISLLKALGRPDIPVFQGAGEALMGNRQPWLAAEERLFGNSEYLGAFARPRPLSEFPGGENAVDFIVRKVKEFPNEITILATGPATNIALAVKTRPEIVPLIKRIIYMGGAVDIPGNTTPAAEFNFWFDPEAARIALRTPFREQILVPNDICERVYYTKAVYDRITAASDTAVVKMFRERHGPSFQSDPGKQSFVWDALAAAFLLKPGIAVKLEERFVDVDVNYGPNYGRSIGYHEARRRALSSPENFPAGTQKVKILFDIDRQAYWDLFVDLMTRPVPAP